MWLRTAMNYQYRYGTSTSQALSALYNEGRCPLSPNTCSPNQLILFQTLSPTNTHEHTEGILYFTITCSPNRHILFQTLSSTNTHEHTEGILYFTITCSPNRHILFQTLAPTNTHKHTLAHSMNVYPFHCLALINTHKHTLGICILSFSKAVYLGCIRVYRSH